MNGWKRCCAALVLAALASAGAVSSAAAQDQDPSAAPLMSADFEQPFTGRAPGWVVNWWGSPGPQFSVWRETAEGLVRGTAAQGFSLLQRPPGADAHLTYRHAFTRGKTYRLVMHLKSNQPTTATVQLRRDAVPWNVFAQETLQLDGSWRRVEIQGRYQWDEVGSIRVLPSVPGVSVYVDDVTLTEVEPAAPIDLPARSDPTVTETTVATADMEGTHTGAAPGWKVNYWGSPSPSWSIGRETQQGLVHSGASSMRFRLNSRGSGDAHLTFPFRFVKGRSYRVGLFLRAATQARVTVQVRHDVHPWRPAAIRTLQLDQRWQRLELTGTYLSDVAGTLRVALHDVAADIYVDDLSIAELQGNDSAPALPAAVPDHFFGMHMLKLGTHVQWPALGFRTLRLWDTGTAWRHLQPDGPHWNWNGVGTRRLDMYVNHALKNDPGTRIIYTLGQTPQWASSTPDLAGLYGPGATGMPADPGHWRDYVRTLANRYRGRITHWELWNEPDFQRLFSGTAAQMVELARIAREELQAADPANKLIAPGVSDGQGMAWLNDFLAAGGGRHVDAIAAHWYFGTRPDSVLPKVRNLRAMVDGYGLGHLPLWVTEGGPGCDSAVEQCASFAPTPQQIRSAGPRGLFTLWVAGAENFDHYFMEKSGLVTRLVGSDYQTPTEAGSAWREAVAWLRGAQVADAYRVAGKVQVLHLVRGTGTAVVLWSTEPFTEVNLPTAWRVARWRSIGGAEGSLPASRRLVLGHEPVMLMP